MEELRSLMVPAMLLDKRILRDPAPSIGVTAIKGGAMEVAFRAYTLPDDNGLVTGSLMEQIKDTLMQHRITGPVPISHTYVHAVPA